MLQSVPGSFWKTACARGNDVVYDDLGIKVVVPQTVVSHPYRGITIIQKRVRLIDMSTGTSRAVDTYAAKVDLTASGLRPRFTPSGGTREVFRQTTKEFVEQEKAVLGVNTHFFQPYPSTDLNSNLMGFAVADGEVISPFCAQPPSESGGPYVDQGYAIVDNAPAINIDPDNVASMVHRDPSDVSNQSVLEDTVLWNTFAGSAQIVTSGTVTVPTYAPTGVLKLGLPLWLQGGYSNSNSWYNLVRPRSSIGISQDGHTLFFFASDLWEDSLGMTVTEMANAITALGAYNAINTDGGGSIGFVLRDPTTLEVNYLNKPQMGTPREVGGNLAICVPWR
jgi:hypothetical protein